MVEYTPENWVNNRELLQKAREVLTNNLTRPEIQTHAYDNRGPITPKKAYNSIKT